MVTSPIEGTEVFETLRNALEQKRRDLAECQEQSSRLDQQLRDLLARRGEMLLGLAKHYLPDISRPTIAQTFEGIRDDLLAILARREALQQAIRNEVSRYQRTRDDRNLSLDEVTKLLNAKVAARERLEAQVAESLKGNGDYQERSTLALQAEQSLHRNEQRVADITSEAEAKLPAYKSSRLFRYLLERGFGTTDYAAKGWTRSIDSWIAGMIDFANARIGYDFLTKTPQLVAEEVTRRREQFTNLMEQVEAIQKAEADRLGLTTVLQEGEALGTRRDVLVKEIEALHAHVEQKTQQLAALDQNQNQFTNEAIDKLKAFLGETRLAILETRARQTPEPQDDAIVRDLVKLDRETETLQPRLEESTQRQAILDREQDGIDVLVRRYRQANFDSQRSYFEGDFDLARNLSAFQDGQLDTDRFWQSIQASQRFRPHWIESTTDTGTQVIGSPAGRILMGSILEMATQAMQNAAVRGVQRRGDIFGPSSYPTEYQDSSPSSYEPPSSWSPPSSSSSNEGSFTSGQGF